MTRRFLIRFALGLLALGVLQAQVPRVEENCQLLCAVALAYCLQAIGWQGVERQDVLVTFPHGAFAIGAECTGLALMGMLTAFVMAHPASRRDRLAGISIGVVLIFLANLLRLVSCAFILRYLASWFDFTHEYAWQVGLVGVTLAIALAWQRRVSAKVGRYRR